jgi:antitoxin (DNA-binding transcriptional repressor) of toxin-antitoxin stability system
MAESTGKVKPLGAPTAIEVTLGADEVRPQLSLIWDRAIAGGRTIVTRHERVVAVVIGPRDFETLRDLDRTDSRSSAKTGTR